MMEKSNKLKLKRKVFQKDHVETKRTKFDKSNVADKDNEEEMVVLSSDSESEVNVSTQTNSVTVPVGHIAHRGFLGTSNNSLNNLRKLVLSLTPKDRDFSKLSHFPAYDVIMKPKVDIYQEDRLHEIQGRLQPIDSKQQVKELSPFPQVCKHLMKKYQKQIHISSPVLLDDKHNEEAIKLSFEECDKTSLSKPLVENSKDSEHYSANSKGSVSKNRQPVIPHVSSLNNSGNTGSQVPGSLNISGLGVTRNEGKIPKLFDNHNVTSEQNRSKSLTLSRIDLPEDNAALMRDRNSNLYALRCQNRQKSIERRNIGGVANPKSNVVTGSKSRNTPASDISTNLVRGIEDAEHSTNLDMQLGEGHGKEKCVENNKASFKDQILNNKMTSHEGVTGLNSEQHQSVSNSWKCLQLKTKENANTESIAQVERTEKSGEKRQENVAQDKVVQQIELKVHIHLQRCPLCQIQFDSSYGQMEIDAHIATCLSNSEDDVMW